MLNHKLNAQQEVSPTPEQVLRHHRMKGRGGTGRQAQFPPSSYQCFVVHGIVKGILPIPKGNY